MIQGGSTKIAGGQRQRAFSMVVLMLLMSLGPLLTTPVVSAHAEPSGVTWPLEGSNDTGWITLDAVGAVPETGQRATADWELAFAPGAELSNVTLEVRASGQNGTTIEEPHLVVDGMGTALFDWRGLGVLGQAGAFTTGTTYNGRLNPNSNSGAGWDLPSDAELTKMIVEVLAPADPLVSLTPYQFDLRDSVTNPDTGVLYIAANEQLLLLNANNDPPIIDVYEFSEEDGVVDMVMDTNGGLLHLLLGDGTFRAVSLTDSAFQTPLADADVDRFIMTASGDVVASGASGMVMWDGAAWSTISSAATGNGGAALSMLEVNGVVYAAIDDVGVLRYNTATSTALSTWSSANTLHSDSITHMTTSGNQLLLASPDNGLARFDFVAGFWLSTWSSANWLTSDTVAGVERVGSTLFVLSGDALHSYNTTNGVFSTTYDLSTLGLAYDGVSLLTWPSTAGAAPSSDALLVDDGSGQLVHLSPGQTPFVEGAIRLASAPATDDMTALVELDDVLYIGSGDNSMAVLRYDIGSAAWLTPLDVGDNVIEMAVASDGSGTNSLFLAMEGSPVVEQINTAGTSLQTYDGTSGCYPSSAAVLSMVADTNSVVMSLDGGVFVHFDRATGGCTAYDTTNGLPTSFVGDVALYGGMAYLATENQGVLRYDISNDTWLEPWGSTGINGVESAPVAMVGDVLHLGLPGYGVARKDLSTGEILSPILAGNRGGPLPSNQIFALESDGSNLYIGTQQGARKWDGNQATSFGQGNSWQTRPQQFYDFVIDGSGGGGDLYAGTNIGVCKYDISTMGIDDCQNVYDGMPNWATISVGVDSDYVYGGTTSGVGLITKSNFQHDYNWGQGTQTGNAVVEIMGDIAYIGTDGLGVLRYNITANEWLVPFTEANGVLDGGNDDVTGLVADIRQDMIWVGGSDGFQLINITNGAEEYDIERTSNQYTADGSPYDMMIHNNIMYYHSGEDSDEVSRLNVSNGATLSNLDVGAEVGENGGDIVGMELSGDTLMVSVVSGQWWNRDGSGGIARWNTTTSAYETNVLPTGSIDRVTSYRSSNGNTWVAWGELRLDLYDSSQTLVNSWDDVEFPIRGIVEHNGETMFATEEGIARYNENTNAWNSTWEAGNGLPGNAGDIFYELWTDGTNLVVGGAEFNNFGQFQEGIVSHRNGAGAWTSYPADSTNNMPDGYPISMEMCGGVLNIAMYNNNGGIARIDLANATVLSDFDRSQLDGTGPASVTCDNQDTLYIGYYNDNQPISRYSYATSAFLNSLTTSSHNLPSDRVWYDALSHSGSQLIVGHAVGNSGSNLISGGFSTLVSSGATALQAQIQGAGSPVTSLQWLSGSSEWLVGRAGGSSGYSEVATLSSNGMQTVVDLPGLVSGQVTSMVANATHLWATTGSSGQGASGTGLLQGTFMADGTVEWEFGWTLPGNTVAGDLHLHGTDLFIASTPGGMLKLDTQTRTISQVGGSLHGKLDTMHVYNSQLVVGLAGDGGSPPGVQMFNPLTSQFGNGRLISGLPSNIVNGFTETSDVLYIATDGGIGRWNYTTDDWMDSITMSNGLPNDIVEDVRAVGNSVYMATPTGVFIWDPATQTGSTLTTGDGLMGQSAWGLVAAASPVSGTATVFVSHDGRGSDRPGVSLINPSTQQVVSTHRFDQLPSNTATALAADWWGLHIATEGWPLTHWNGSSGDFEDGVGFFQSQYPIFSMYSNGDEVLALGGENDGMLVEARTVAHASLAGFRPGEVIAGTLGANHVWIVNSDGLNGWQTDGQYTQVEPASMRRALPLTVRSMGNGGGINITDMTHLGMPIELVGSGNAYALDSAQGTPGVHGLLFQNVPVVLTSPTSGAAVWARSVALEYDVTLDISGDPNLQNNLQDAVDNGQLYNNTRHVALRLFSPSNGSLEVRLTYDYIRSDTPVVLQGLEDRPDDGGGVLSASWTLVHDEDFARYLIFLNEGPWSTPPGEMDLLGVAPDKAVSLHSRLAADVETANGQPLKDGAEYYAVAVVEYADGRWGKVSAPFGPASPSDEVPLAPAWATASAMGSLGDDGDIQLEWSRCTALDLASTNVYVSTTPMTDALGRTPFTSYAPNEGNQSIIKQTPGVPVWIGLTCVDEAGQENLSDVTVVGPVVPTGELNDNEAPEPIQGTTVIDVPDDEGGRLKVAWAQSEADDCAFYTVYMKQGDHALSDGELGSVEGYSQAAVINPCDENETIVSTLDGVPLIDGQLYTVGIVAYDVWLNGNIDDVLLKSAAPLQNVVGQGTTPPRITSLMAFDRPNDDGTAIDVVWEPSTVEDFASYTVWVANAPVEDLSFAYAAFGTDESLCGCFSFNKQWIDERTNPIEIPLSNALYTSENDDLTQGVPGLIQPGVELFVAVTVHDLRGNVHLTDLTQATVTPVDNINDNTAPDRLTDLTLRDRPNDDGSALLLEFELAEEDDIAAYVVFADTYDFGGVVGQQTNLANDPLWVAELDRNPDLPLVIERVGRDTPVQAGQEIWVAVVAVDSSGNAHRSMLTMVSGIATDEGITDPGNYLPDIERVEADWDGEGNILVEWRHSMDNDVKGYHIYISEDMFTSTDNATYLEKERNENNFTITSEIYPGLDNETTYYVAVTPYDEDGVAKKTVEAVVVEPVNGPEGAGDGEQNDGQLSLESLLTTPNLIAAGMVLIIVILLILVVRSRNSTSRRSKTWELQEATWGIQDASWDTPATPAAPPVSAPAPPPGVSTQQANNIYGGANDVQSDIYGRTAYQAPQPVLKPQVDPALLEGLLDEPAKQKSPEIDTSFLDDLL